MDMQVSHVARSSGYVLLFKYLLPIPPTTAISRQILSFKLQAVPGLLCLLRAYYPVRRSLLGERLNLVGEETKQLTSHHCNSLYDELQPTGF
jgi:hypothetical protein